MHIQPACLNKFLFQIDQSLFLSQFFNAKSWQSQEKSYSNAAQYFLPNRSQMKTRKKHSRKWAWFINRNRITTRKNFSTHKTGTKTTRRTACTRIEKVKYFWLNAIADRCINFAPHLLFSSIFTASIVRGTCAICVHTIFDLINLLSPRVTVCVCDCVCCFFDI